MDLLKYVLRRLVLLVPVLLGVSILTFLISHLVPGDPVRLAAGPQATPEMIQVIREEYALDKPLPVQYLIYMNNLLHGNWGRSILSRREVADELSVFFPATFELVAAAMLIAVLLGVPLGVVSAIHRDQWSDHLSRLFSLTAVSMPSFWLAILAQLGLGLHLGILPISGRLSAAINPPDTITGLLTIDSLLTGNRTAFADALVHLLLPALVLSFPALATITRMMRAGVLEVLQEDYVRTERANGLSERLIFFKYILKNAFISTLTMIGLSFGWAMAGSILVESVFDWPGVGLYATKSAMTLDFQPILGMTILYGVVFSITNLVVDILYGALDPRIRYA